MAFDRRRAQVVAVRGLFSCSFLISHTPGDEGNADCQNSWIILGTSLCNVCYQPIFSSPES